MSKTDNPISRSLTLAFISLTIMLGIGFIENSLHDEVFTFLTKKLFCLRPPLHNFP